MATAIFVLIALAVLVAYFALNRSRGQRKVREARVFRESRPFGQLAWLGNLGGISDIELFDTERETLRLQGDRPATLECTNDGIQFTVLEPYTSGAVVPPVTIPWNKIHNAGLATNVPTMPRTYGTPTQTAVAIAVSERWMQELEDQQYPTKREPTEKERASMEKLAAKYSDDDYDETMREEYGDLYSPGLWMVDFLSYDVTGLVDAIKMRATGVPEKADDNW
jgi:hypothetical protein